MIFCISFILFFLGIIYCCFHFIYPQKYNDLIKKYSNEYRLSPSLVASIINVESNYNSKAISSVGAIGLMQIMPSTAKWLTGTEQNLLEPETNIKIGCMYLNYLKTHFLNLKCILAAYNAGPNKVLIWLKDEEFSKDGINLIKTPYIETNNYIVKVQNNLKVYNLIY